MSGFSARFPGAFTGGPKVKGKSKLIWPVALMALILVSPAMRAAATPAAKSAAPAGGGINHYHYDFNDSVEPWGPLADGTPSYSLTIAGGDNGCADPFGGL